MTAVPAPEPEVPAEGYDALLANLDALRTVLVAGRAANVPPPFYARISDTAGTFLRDLVAMQTRGDTQPWADLLDGEVVTSRVERHGSTWHQVNVEMGVTTVEVLQIVKDRE